MKRIGLVQGALRLDTGTSIEPFGDRVGAVPVGNGTLQSWQEGVLASLGIPLLERAPESGPYLLFTDRTFFSADAVRRLVAAGPGRLHIDDADWWSLTGPLQEVPGPGIYELALHPGGPPTFEGLAARAVPHGLEDMPLPRVHPAFQHAMGKIRIGPCLAQQVHHWSHILRVNQLAMAATVHEAKRDYEGSPWWRKTGIVLAILARARGASPDKISRALCRVGKGARIHPTAVVELSEIGDDVEIGAHAVVRASVLGKGCKVDDHATVQMSVMADGATVSRYGFLHHSVCWPNAFVSTGGGFQLCVFGRDSFVAWGATILDLSFGEPAPVWHQGARVSSGAWLLGAAIGHDARLGNGVRVNYGATVPNGAFLVADPEPLFRHWGDEPLVPGSPMIVRGGKAAPIRARTQSAPAPGGDGLAGVGPGPGGRRGEAGG
jgi:acetyltransferase-like isoleucine patch superfamily enzyme